MATKYQLGDPVWAKMKGFSPWPAKIVEPTKEVKRPSMKKSMHCVFFFGTDNYAWVQEDLIFPYEEYKDQYMKTSKKSGSFKEAVEAITDYIEGGPKAKSGELPSIEEELASMFPIGSEKRRSKKQNTTTATSTTTTPRENSRLSQSSLSSRKADSPLPSNSPEPPQSDEGSITTETVVKPDRKKIPKTKKASNKRTLSDSSSTSSLAGTKKQRIEKQNENLVGLNSIGSPDEGTDGAAGSQSPDHGATGDVAADGAAASPSSSHNSVSVARRSASPSVLASHYNSSSTPNKSSSGLLSRPTYVTRPVTPVLDVERVSEVLKQKKVVASELKFGFLGLGIMGQGIVKNLLNSGHQVIVWNRTPSKCREFVKAGATKGQTPADVVQAADITFCCVSDPLAAKEMVFGNCGVLQEIGNNKGYVEMTSIDPETSADIAEAIIARNGRYLEAPVSGSKKPAEDGMLIILAAGDRSLFTECTTCFQAMGKHAFYLGDVGNGSKMNLILNMLLGTTLASLAEAMALADRAGLSQRDLVEILELGDMNCPAIVDKGQDLPKVAQATFASEYFQQALASAAGLSLGEFSQKYQVTITVREREQSGRNKGGIDNNGPSGNQAPESVPSSDDVNTNDAVRVSQSVRDVVFQTFRRSKRMLIKRSSRSSHLVDNIEPKTVNDVMSTIESVATRGIITEPVNNVSRNQVQVDNLAETINLVAKDYDSVETMVTDKQGLNLADNSVKSADATITNLDKTINSITVNDGADGTALIEAKTNISKKRKFKIGKDKDTTVVDNPQSTVCDVSEPSVSDKVPKKSKNKSKETGSVNVKGLTYTTLAHRTQAMLSDPEANKSLSSNGEIRPDQVSGRRKALMTHAPVLNINSARNANNQVRTILVRQSFEKPEPPMVKRHVEFLMSQIEGHVTRRRLREELAKPTCLVKHRETFIIREPIAKPRVRIHMGQEQSSDAAAAGASRYNRGQSQGNTKSTGRDSLQNPSTTRGNSAIIKTTPNRYKKPKIPTPDILQITAPLSPNRLRNVAPVGPTPRQPVNTLAPISRTIQRGVTVLQDQTSSKVILVGGQLCTPLPPLSLRGQITTLIPLVRPRGLMPPLLSPRSSIPVSLTPHRPEDASTPGLNPVIPSRPVSILLSPNRFQGSMPPLLYPGSPISRMPIPLSPNRFQDPMLVPLIPKRLEVHLPVSLSPNQIKDRTDPTLGSDRVLGPFAATNSHVVALDSSLSNPIRTQDGISSPISKPFDKKPRKVANKTIPPWESDRCDLSVAKPMRTYSRPNKYPAIEATNAGVSVPSAISENSVDSGVPCPSTNTVTSLSGIGNSDTIEPVGSTTMEIPSANKTAALRAAIASPPETPEPTSSADESSDSDEVMSHCSYSDSDVEVIAEYKSSYFDSWEYGFRIPNPVAVVDLVSESDTEENSKQNSLDKPSTSSGGAESLIIMDTYSLNNNDGEDVDDLNSPIDLSKLYYRTDTRFGGIKMNMKDFLRVKGIELKDVSVDLNKLLPKKGS